MEKNKIIRVAFGSVPKDGGTYTFYRNIRPVLNDYGIDIRCVTVGKTEADLVEPSLVDKGCVTLAAHTGNIKKQAQIFSHWCENMGVDIVLGINSVAILSALPHLPEKIRVMARCANSFDHGYKITVSCYDRLAAIIAQTPRQVEDLSNKYDVSMDKLALIPNGIEANRFKDAVSKIRGKTPKLQIGFLGRLEHGQKGVLFLPGIIHLLEKRGIAFKLKIAGKGVHRRSLEKELNEYVYRGVVEFMGSISPHKIPEFLAGIDVLLFTSQFEGCPNALLEAMMAGCVPVSSRLEGITDFIIKEGKTGFLCPVGACEAFADHLVDLNGDREKLRKVSKTVAKDAEERFGSSRAADDYNRTITKVMEMPPPKWSPMPWREFQVDSAFKQTWSRHIPSSVKKGIKNMLFHMGFSNRYNQL